MNKSTNHIFRPVAIYFSALILIGASFCSCSSNTKVVEVVKTDGYQQNHGPFDANGNYIENWADAPPDRKYVTSRSKDGKQQTTVITQTDLAQLNSQSQPSQYKAKSYPKTTVASNKSTKPRTTKKTSPKTTKTAIKVTPRAKPPIYHTIIRGDTLYDLARRYKTSVSAIRTANNLKGSNIIAGKRLIIPRG